MMKTLDFGFVAMVVSALASAGAAPMAIAQEDLSLPPFIGQSLGAELADMWCDSCHVTGNSSNETALDVAPSFQSLAPLVRADADHYRAFLSEPHNDAMGDISLSRGGIEVLLRYIQESDSAGE